MPIPAETQPPAKPKAPPVTDVLSQYPRRYPNASFFVLLTLVTWVAWALFVPSPMGLIAGYVQGVLVVGLTYVSRKGK